MLTPSEILDAIVDYSGLNLNSLSEKMGLNRPQALYDIQNGKTKSFTKNISTKIFSVFPEINKGWLMTGEGEMISTEHNPLRPIAGDTQATEYISLLKKKDEQIDRLLTIIETLTKK